MKATTLFNRFIRENEFISSIAKAVIKQMGGADSYTLQELYNVRDASYGYSGFIYYSDTVAFWKKVRRHAVPFMENEANELDARSALDMVKSFNYCQRYEVENRDIAIALYGRLADADTSICNLLSWYCLETVAYHFNNWCYENDIDNDTLDNLK